MSPVVFAEVDPEGGKGGNYSPPPTPFQYIVVTYSYNILQQTVLLAVPCSDVNTYLLE